MEVAGDATKVPCRFRVDPGWTRQEWMDNPEFIEHRTYRCRREVLEVFGPDSLNQELSASDALASLSVAKFLKNVGVNGVLASPALKKVSTVFPGVTGSFPTYGNILSTISAVMPTTYIFCAVW